MAFLQHPPRRRQDGNNSDELQEMSKPGSQKRSPRLHTNALHPHDAIKIGERFNGRDEAAADWSIVFPGRASASTSSARNNANSSSEQLATPFRDHNEVDATGLQLALPPLHDGTGRFTRPSSPSYAGDDELDITPADLSPTSPMVPISGGLLNSSFMFEHSSDDEDDDDDVLDLNDAELATSMLFTESELGTGTGSGGNEEKQSATRSSRGKRNPSPAFASSSSWAFMQHRNSTTSSVGLDRRTTDSWALVPPAAVLTSDEEDEVENMIDARTRAKRDQRKKKEDAAYEEAIGSAHLAQSAGIYARVPKRRHRKNGESEKGSKRSNTSELRSQPQSRPALQSRRSQTSAASAVSRGRSRLMNERGVATRMPASQPKSKGERLLNVILSRVFGVDDEEVLQAFLRDEGRLQLTHEEHERGISAAVSSRTALNHLNNGEDDIWTRNQRHRHLRKLLEGKEEGDEDGVELEPQDDEDEDDEGLHMTNAVGHVRRSGVGQSTRDRYPRRPYVRGNVAEPSLTEALHATVLSGLRVVPSGLSILLAGSTSVRFVNYLVGRIGPGFTDRMRKLVDDVADDGASDMAAPDNVGTVVTKARSLRSNSSATVSDDSSVRFAGSAHPAIAAAAAAAANANASPGSSRNTLPAFEG